MTNLIKYRKYYANIVYEAEDDLLVGRLLGINDIVSFEGKSVKKIKIAFKDAVDDYLNYYKEIGEQPNKPFSGKVMFRIAPEIHAKAALAAQLKGISLNQWAEEVLNKGAADR